MPPEIVLINANTLKPPVSPIGLEFVAESLVIAGLPWRIIDLSFEADWQAALKTGFRNSGTLMVGISVRNTDDCSFISGRTFLPWIKEVVGEVRKHTDAPVFLGGVGFSVMPDVVLKATGADAGIAGDGEEAVALLARRLLKNQSYQNLPNLVYRQGGKIIHNQRREVDLNQLPAPARNIFNNRLYQELGAMVGIETKRGCASHCIYCADPVAKGTRVRLRPPDVVAQEFQNLMAQDVTWFHLCDSEFNLPASHAKEVCQTLIDSGIGNRIRWYAYCSPVPFDGELVRLMKSAGCAGVNFGVDSLCDEQLRRLGRTYSSADICGLVELLHREKVNYMFDLLVGGPGETRDTVRESLEEARKIGVALAGIAAGVRVYSGTRLAGLINEGLIRNGLHHSQGDAGEQPLYYLSPGVGDDITGFINELVGDDPRFMVLAKPGERSNYNYAGDELLSRLIKAGARGAYWDILRSYRIKSQS